MQADEGSTKTIPPHICCNEEHLAGWSRFFEAVFTCQGIRAFYSGLVPTLMIAIPNSILYYSSYDGIKWYLEPYFTNK